MQQLKGIVYLKMKILLSFTYLYVIQNLYDFIL